jgi:hypothetical protein
MSSELLPAPTVAKAASLDNPDTREPRDDRPLDMRPDLSEFGIVEHERGVCEDTYANRAILRKNVMNWSTVYDANGSPTEFIAVHSKEAMLEKRLMSLDAKRPLLTDPKNSNSDYINGLELLLEDDLISLVPPWVVGVTKKWQKEQVNGLPAGSKKTPAALPHRCSAIKTDGIRCMLWGSGLLQDGGLCRIHLRTIRKPGEDVERARIKLAQGAPSAVDMLERLMETAESEAVRLKASTEILDRAGIKGGYEFKVDVEITEGRPAHEVISERLSRLAAGAEAMLAAAARAENEIVDGEEVEESGVPTDDV